MSDGLHRTLQLRKKMCSIVKNIDDCTFGSVFDIVDMLVLQPVVALSFQQGSLCEAEIATKRLYTTVQIGLKDGS
jgi:hypothetical protein